MDYLRAQVAELCTNYGEIRHFFWDMNVPEVNDPAVNDMLRRLQPNMVINDRGFDDGDFGTPEREYKKNATDRQVVFERPTEACNSVGTQSWGYRKNEDYYSTAFLIHSIDSMMAKGAHYLLNVGPDADGKIPDISADILREIGAWYGKTREAFGDSEPATELTTNPDVLLTRRENTLYAHIRAPARSDAVILPPLAVLPARAVLLNTGAELRCVTEMLPMCWKSQDHVLAIRGLPIDILAGTETLVIRLEFEEPLPDSASSMTEFKG